MADTKSFDQLAIEAATKLQAEFHELWKKQGEPDPSSNAYLELNRAFYYAKGIEVGIKLASGLEHND